MAHVIPILSVSGLRPFFHPIPSIHRVCRPDHFHNGVRRLILCLEHFLESFFFNFFEYRCQEEAANLVSNGLEVKDVSHRNMENELFLNLLLLLRRQS